jgi:hypothetical protein
MGFRGQPFAIYKFRTMAVGAETAGLGFTEENDARISRLGRILRRYRLDELPQILNILRGEMSWIGPRPESLALAQRFADHAAARGVSSGQLAVAWVLHNRLINGVIAGPRTLAQWQDYIAALSVAVGPDDEALVDALVAPGHASTPGYTDPIYPVTGRQPR